MLFSATKYIPSIANDYNCQFSRNDQCNARWSVRDWKIDETSSKTREFIDDSRWEGTVKTFINSRKVSETFNADLPTILVSNVTGEFKRRFHLENAKKVGFSVRAVGAVEVFYCTGWNPSNYPCYYYHIDKREIFFNNLTMLEPNFNYTLSPLDHSQVTT